MEITEGGDFSALATGRLDNGAVAVEFLREAGLRLVRLFLAGYPDNLLAETPDLTWETPHGRYHLRGGHRLWVAPETAARTSIPEDEEMRIELRPDGARIIQPVESHTGLRKSIEVILRPGETRLVLHHRIANEDSEPIELAPWAITMLRPGGVAILPQPMEPTDPDGLQPNRSLVLWPQTRWDDPRLRLADRFTFVESRATGRPTKIGIFDRPGWMGYLRGGVLFIKRFTPQPTERHADLGCNAEVYVCDDYIELESLGPLVLLAPGETVEHVETWELHRIKADQPLPAPYGQALEALGG